jgi:hypothetical protein
MGELEADSDFFRPFQAEITLFAKFRVAFGDVARCVPRPEMPKRFRAAGLLKVGDAETAEDVESALRVFERLSGVSEPSVIAVVGIGA